MASFPTTDTSNTPRLPCGTIQVAGGLHSSLVLLESPFLLCVPLKAANLLRHLVMDWSNIPSFRVGSFQNPKRPTRHSVFFVIVESAKYNNLSFTLETMVLVALTMGPINI